MPQSSKWEPKTKGKRQARNSQGLTQLRKLVGKGEVARVHELFYNEVQVPEMPPPEFFTKVSRYQVDVAQRSNLTFDLKQKV